MTLILQLITTAVLIAADQISKLWATNVLEKIGEIPIVEGVFNLRYVENSGAAFSMLSGQRIILVAIPIIASALMLYALFAKRIKSRIGNWGLALILAGAIGNLIDRIRYGAVVDMFDFELINFPVFNVADICVTIGAVLFFIYMIFFYDNKSEKKDD